MTTAGVDAGAVETLGCTGDTAGAVDETEAVAGLTFPCEVGEDAAGGDAAGGWDGVGEDPGALTEAPVDCRICSSGPPP